MEQEPQEEITEKRYRVFWHQNIQEDFEKIPKSLTDKIIAAVEHRLSNAPLLIGEPLKGTIKRLWKVAFSKYRIIYTIKPQHKEVWVLSVMKREIVYDHAHVKALLQMAMALQHKIKNAED